MTDLSPWPSGEEPECPECGAPAVRKLHTGRTLMAGSSGYDDDGVYHNHDPNINKTRVECENGHQWTETSGRRTCPAPDCDWPEDGQS